MKKQILLTLFGLSLMQTVFAASTQYVMHVDGLACPYCAYVIEKKLRAIKGVEKSNVDLDKGLVTAEVKEGTSLGEEQMKQLFQDAGFTFRSMEIISARQKKEDKTESE